MCSRTEFELGMAQMGLADCSLATIIAVQLQLAQRFVQYGQQLQAGVLLIACSQLKLN